MVEDVIIHQATILIEEVEAQTPALQSSADDTDVVRSFLILLFFEVSDGALSLDLDGGVRASIVVDDDELLLLPGGLRVDEVPVHHPIAVGVPFLEHHQTRSPVLEGSVGVGVSKIVRDTDLLETVDILVSTTLRDGLLQEWVVVIVGVNISEDELITRAHR